MINYDLKNIHEIINRYDRDNSEFVFMLKKLPKEN